MILNDLYETNCMAHNRFSDFHWFKHSHKKHSLETLIEIFMLC